MATLDQALASLEQSVGAERSSAIVRRLLHVPGALAWLTEEPVRAALAQLAGEDPPFPATALLAATGYASLTSLPQVWPAALAARRAALLSGEAIGEDQSADDVLILAGELLRGDRGGGAAMVQMVMTETSVDWRAALAVAWRDLADPRPLGGRLTAQADLTHLPALVSALRANSEGDAARALAEASGAHLDSVLLRLVETGDIAFAESVASAANAGATETAKTLDPIGGILQQRLRIAWESRREELAALADGLAIVASADGDAVTAVEARRHALQLGPSTTRLANVAITLAEQGDAAGALSLIPPSPETHDLGFAAGWAYLKGGAIEKGRAMLIESALNALEFGEPKATPAMAARLVACGEPGMALDVYRAVLDDVPSDASTRCAYAHALAECADFHGALAEARLTLALDDACAAARLVEIEALRHLGQPAEALAILQAAPADLDPSLWGKAVECALALGDTRYANSLLADPPVGVSAGDQTLLAAKSMAAEGRQAEAVALLEAATLQHPTDSTLWLGLARLRHDSGDPEASGETLRRASQMAPGSASVHAALAHSLRGHGQPSEALAASQEALRIDPRSAQANLEAGRAWLDLGRPSEAVEPLRAAYRRVPGDQETRLALAAAYEGNGDIESARTLFAHLADSAPAEAWLISGRLDLAGDPPITSDLAKSAAAKLLRARALGAQDALLSFWLGRAFEDGQDPAHAAEAYSEYLRHSPRSGSQPRFAAVHKALCLLAAGDGLAAIREFESLRAVEGQDPKFLGALTQAYLSVGFLDEVRQTAETLLALDPVDRAGLQAMAAVAHQTGDWKRTAEVYRAAAQKSPADSDLWLTAAEASLSAGEPALASHPLERALTVSADGAIRRRAAHVLVGLGQASRAAGLLKEVAAAQPDQSAIWMELADVAARSRDPATSIEALSHAADLAPADPEIQSRRAAALWSVGRRRESIGAWQNALDLAPEDLHLQRSLAKALIINGEIQDGLNLFAEALERHPEDMDLLTETALATLRHGSPQEAVDLLTRAAGSSPSERTLTALGEGWLRLNQPERSFEILTKATALPQATAGTWALYAEAAVSLGDSATAEAALVEARRPDDLTADDRIALSRAELRLANWGDALTALAPILSTGEFQHEIALAETIVRVLEARWLFGEAALARSHSPAPDVPSDSLLTWLETSLAGPMGSTEEGKRIEARLHLVRSAEDERALEALRALSSQDPATTEPLEGLAIALLRRQRPAEALEVLRRAQPDQLGVNWQAILAGIAHLQSGNPSLARQAFVDASQDAGMRPVAQSLLARAHLAQGYSDSAVAGLNAALSQWTDEPAWHAALADLYLAQTDLDAALPHLQAAVEIDPENASWRLTYGRALRDAGHVLEAFDAFQRLLPLMPSEAGVWHEAGDLALAAGDFPAAETLFDRASSLAPNEPTHLVGQAHAAFAAGKLREAQRLAESAVRLGADRAESLACLAAIVAKQGEPDRAVELLDRAAAVAEDASSLRQIRTRLLIEIARADQAAQELREHLAADPDDEEGWSALGEALEATRDYPAAGQALEAALRLRPRSAPLQVRLARVERKAGQLDRALELLREAEGLDPNQADLALELGQVYEARRELDHALDAYCRSTEINPRSPEAFRRAGHVFKSLKAYREAEGMLERAAELDPTDTATLQQLAAVRALELVHGGTYRMAVNP